MGIRFFCEACGKKLNIKVELAGKKGRCPQCQAKISIPQDSSLKSSAKPPGASGENTVASSSEPATPSPATTKPSQSKSAFALPGGDQSGQPISASPPTASAGSSEILQEDPQAKWFVRPSSGGQFGPAEADVMQTWLNEGRVGRDSFVWREGWEEWRNAGEVFATEFGVPENPVPENPVPEKPVTQEPAVAAHPGQLRSRKTNHQRARQRAQTIGILLIVVLVIVSIALAAVLVYVNPFSGSNREQGKKESAALSLELLEIHNQGSKNLIIL